MDHFFQIEGMLGTVESPMVETLRILDRHREPIRRAGPGPEGQPAGSVRSCISQAWSSTCQAMRRAA
jgi:hypothetical protein